MRRTRAGWSALASPRRPGWATLGIALVLAAATVAVCLLVQAVTLASAQGQRPEAKPAPRPAAPAPAKGGEAKGGEVAAKDAAAKPAAAVRTETVVYDRWTVVCQDRVDGSVKRSCTAILKIVDPNRNQIVLAWALARGASGHIETAIQTPTGVQIQRGLTLKLGDRAARVLPFSSCEPQNCEASAALDAAMLRELQTATQGIATIYAKDGRGIQFTVPLEGIEKALSAVES